MNFDEPIMPEDFLGQREEKFWRRLLSTRSVSEENSELLAIYCRTAVDEEAARKEMTECIGAGDANGAKTYGSLAISMRAQMDRILAILR